MNIHKKNFYRFYQFDIKNSKINVVREAGGFRGFKITHTYYSNNYHSVRYNFFLMRFQERAIFYVRTITRMS